MEYSAKLHGLYVVGTLFVSLLGHQSLSSGDAR